MKVVFDVPAPAVELADEVLTVDEAAEESGLSVATIRRRCSKGEIPARKVGSQWLVFADEFRSSKSSKGKRAVRRDHEYDLNAAASHVYKTDLAEVWVPDVLRYEDKFADRDHLVNEAAARLAKNDFRAAVRIAVPKSLYSNRPGVLLDLPDRVAFQAVVASIAPTIDLLLGPNVYSSRLSKDPRYFLEHGARKFAKFKEAIPDHVKAHPADLWVASTDISSYFDHILHDRLFAELVHAGVGGEPLRALRVMLSNWALVPGMGLPQGPNASRVLGNFYLAQIDAEMSDDPSITYFRYMDDVRVLASSKESAVAGLRRFESLCRACGLTVSSAKTSVDSFEKYAADGKDKALDQAAYFFDRNLVTRSRPLLKKIMKESLQENSINVRHARFSIWRLAKIREIGMLPRVLKKLELLAPVASAVAAYLKHFLGKKYVQEGIAEFLQDSSRSYSSFLRTWVMAAMLEAASIPDSWKRLAETDAKDRNRPAFLRAVAVCVFAKAGVPRDLAWIRAELRTEHDPVMIRALLVALAYGGGLDKATATAVTAAHPAMAPTTAWLRGRKTLPSLVYARKNIRL